MYWCTHTLKLKDPTFCIKQKTVLYNTFIFRYIEIFHIWIWLLDSGFLANIFYCMCMCNFRCKFRLICTWMRVLLISCVLIGSITCIPPQSAYGQDLSKPTYQKQAGAIYSVGRVNKWVINELLLLTGVNTTVSSYEIMRNVLNKHKYFVFVNSCILNK